MSERMTATLRFISQDEDFLDFLYELKATRGLSSLASSLVKAYYYDESIKTLADNFIKRDNTMDGLFAVEEHYPPEPKQTANGNGSAETRQMMQMMQKQIEMLTMQLQVHQMYGGMQQPMMPNMMGTMTGRVQTAQPNYTNYKQEMPMGYPNGTPEMHTGYPNGAPYAVHYGAQQSMYHNPSSPYTEGVQQFGYQQSPAEHSPVQPAPTPVTANSQSVQSELKEEQPLSTISKQEQFEKIQVEPQHSEETYTETPQVKVVEEQTQVSVPTPVLVPQLQAEKPVSAPITQAENKPAVDPMAIFAKAKKSISNGGGN